MMGVWVERRGRGKEPLVFRVKWLHAVMPIGLLLPLSCLWLAYILPRRNILSLSILFLHVVLCTPLSRVVYWLYSCTMFQLAYCPIKLWYCFDLSDLLWQPLVLRCHGFVCFTEEVVGVPVETQVCTMLQPATPNCTMLFTYQTNIYIYIPQTHITHAAL